MLLRQIPSVPNCTIELHWRETTGAANALQIRYSLPAGARLHLWL